VDGIANTIAFRGQPTNAHLPSARAARDAALQLTVIIPATDAPETLGRCVAALERGDERPDEIIVISEPRGVGPAAARNRGARAGTGEILVFVDADVEVHNDALSRIRRAFEADQELVAVFGSYDDRPAADGVVSTFRNLLHHYVHQSSPGRACTFWSGLGAVRRDFFRAVGGFDEYRYGAPSVEDIELGARLRAAGAWIELDPTVQGTHLKGWSLRTMLWTDFARRGIPWVRLLLERRVDGNVLNLGWRHRASAACSIVAAGAALRGRPAPILAAATGLVLVHRPLYGLLVRRSGILGAAAAVGVHALHDLAAAAAVPAGVAMHLSTRRKAGSSMNLVDPDARAVRAEAAASPSQSVEAGTERTVEERPLRSIDDVRRDNVDTVATAEAVEIADQPLIVSAGGNAYHHG
jgi:GT2 family glycosyltransferase